jgi:hypothetical protein
MAGVNAEPNSGAGDDGRGEPPILSSEEALALRSESLERTQNILRGARVYLSGPMDFVASREEERRNGWRTRVSEFLRAIGTVVYDPLNKTAVVGMPEYGKEDELTASEREKWSFDATEEGDKIRARLCDVFWPTLHIDLRMVDTTDFTIAYCPTNIYSVGTVHEIVMARLQVKPVLFVSPPVAFPALGELERHFAERDDVEGAKLLDRLTKETSLRVNERGIPSLWYMALLDGHYFFDGFGFERYRDRFPRWTRNGLDEREQKYPPKRPLLPYLEELNKKIPKRYDLEQDRYVENEDWLILNPEGI